MTQTLSGWFDRRQGELEGLGITAVVEHAPSDRPKAAAWIDLTSGTEIRRLTVWETGECEIQTAAIASGDVHTEHHDFQSESELLEALDELVRGLS